MTRRNIHKSWNSPCQMAIPRSALMHGFRLDHMNSNKRRSPPQGSYRSANPIALNCCRYMGVSGLRNIRRSWTCFLKREIREYDDEKRKLKNKKDLISSSRREDKSKRKYHEIVRFDCRRGRDMIVGVITFRDWSSARASTWAHRSKREDTADLVPKS